MAPLAKKVPDPCHKHLPMLQLNVNGLKLISNNARNTQLLCEFHNYTSNLTLTVGYSNSH